MDGRVRTGRAPGDAWPSDASRRRRSCGGDQYPAVPLGCALNPWDAPLTAPARGPLAQRLRCPDPEVLRPDVALAERDTRGAGTVLVEERRLEPFSLFRRVERW